MNTAFFDKLINKAEMNNKINPDYYKKYEVKRGLRNENGTGVLVGLTEIGSVYGYYMDGDKKVPDDGKLFYRGINVSDIVEGFQAEDRRGYEETAYLLLFGELPNKEELYEFNQILDENRTLPQHFYREHDS